MKKNTNKLIALAICLSFSYIGYSQNKSIGKPRIGICMLGFVGLTDIKSKDYKVPLGKKVGYQVFLEQPLAKPISLGINFSFGKIYGSQTVKNTDINFQTSLISQSLRVSYNFFPLIKSNRTFQPYLGVGIGFISFRSKGDYKDSSGRLYSSYDSTETIEKDHKYETDLRQANLDRFGNYPQITFSIPYFAGVDIKLKKGLCARVNIEYQQTFSDMLDNISSVGLGARQGKRGYDNLLLISAGINYNLSYAQDDESQPKDMDNDGITDNKDRCDNTPKGVRVDKKGCPVDDNRNGTADYLEKGSQANREFKNFQSEEKKRIADAKEKAKQEKTTKVDRNKNETNNKNTTIGNDNKGSNSNINYSNLSDNNKVNVANSNNSNIEIGENISTDNTGNDTSTKKNLNNSEKADDSANNNSASNNYLPNGNHSSINEISSKQKSSNNLVSNTNKEHSKPSSRVKITTAGNTKSQFLKAIGGNDIGGQSSTRGDVNIGNPDYEKISPIDLSGRLGRFAYADFNKDGVISVNEVTRIIDMFFDKDNPLVITVIDVQDLIDFFFEQK